MDRRFYNNTNMFRESNQDKMTEDCETAENGMNMCLNTDFCVDSPAEINSGILTMAFVDMQPIEDVYRPETALMRGTLFPNIDKPFYRKGVMRK